MVSATTIFGQTPDGADVTSVTIARGGTTARLLTYGARLQDLRRDGIRHPLVLGAQSMEPYLGPMTYYGAIVGPVANRIAGAQFDLNGITHRLDANENGVTTLHGGTHGFSNRNWDLTDSTADSATFMLHHPDGLCGFPGNIDVTARYALDIDGALDITITGTADREVFFSPAFHGYWNLSGAAQIHDHLLQIAAETYLPVDDRAIPQGGPAPVAGTGFDFTQAAPVNGNVDHNFCVDPGQDGPVCTLSANGLSLELSSDQPGLQVYDAGHNDTAPHPGLTGTPYGPVSGIALEPQAWPDAPNRPDFPSSLLRAGETYRQHTTFRFVSKP